MCENSSHIVLFETFDEHCVTLQDFLVNLLMASAGAAMVFLNGVVLHRLVTCVHLDDPGNHFITNLALADSLTGVFVIYDVCYNIIQYKHYIECVLRMGFFQAVNIGSVFTLAALTCDRYIKIFYPYFYQRSITTLRVRVCCVVIWAIALTVGMLPVFGWNRGKKGRRRICQFFGIMAGSYLKLTIFLFYIPFGIMTIAYIRFILLARKHSKAMTTISGVHATSVWKSIKTASIIVGTYFLCWAPVGIFLLLVLETSLARSLPLSPNVIFTYLFGVGLINSLLNPVIYATKIDCIKSRYRQICCLLCRTRCRRPEEVQSGTRTSHGNVSLSRDSAATERELLDVIAFKPNVCRVIVVREDNAW